MSQHSDKEAEKAARGAGKAENLTAQMVDNGLRDAVGTIAGREFLWWLLGICGVGALPLGPDDRTTNFHIGELNIGQQLLARMAEIDPMAYALMQKEHIDRDRSTKSDPERADSAPESDT